MRTRLTLAQLLKTLGAPVPLAPDLSLLISPTIPVHLHSAWYAQGLQAVLRETNVAAALKSSVTIVEDGFYEIRAWVRAVTAIAAGKQFFFVVRDESNANILAVPRYLESVGQTETYDSPFYLYLKKDWRVGILADATAAGETMSYAVQCIQRLQS